MYPPPPLCVCVLYAMASKIYRMYKTENLSYDSPDTLEDQNLFFLNNYSIHELKTHQKASENL